MQSNPRLPSAEYDYHAKRLAMILRVCASAKEAKERAYALIVTRAEASPEQLAAWDLNDSHTHRASSKAFARLAEETEQIAREALEPYTWSVSAGYTPADFARRVFNPQFMGTVYAVTRLDAIKHLEYGPREGLDLLVEAHHDRRGAAPAQPGSRERGLYLVQGEGASRSFWKIDGIRPA